MSSQRVAELRHAFDSAFALTPSTERAQTDEVLAIRVGQDAYALRLTEVSGLIADKAITRLPASIPTLLGLMSSRGAIVSVYDLARLLGSSTDDAPRWVVLTAADPTIGLAFEHFDGFMRVPQDAIAVEETSAPRHSHAWGVVRIAETVRPIVSIPSVVDEIKVRVRNEMLQKER